MLVLRPTAEGRGIHLTKDLETILKQLGYDYMCSPDSLQELKGKLDKENAGTFKEKDLIEHFMSLDALLYTSADELREALRQFDFDNDGKIKMEEFKYFMEEFGQEDNEVHMSEDRI
jgi:Ca2+-binding EF-hand superfamily protein